MSHWGARRVALHGVLASVFLVAVGVGVCAGGNRPQVVPAGRRPLPPAGLSARRHPRHDVRAFQVKYRGRTYHVAELPRCEHLEAVFSYDSSGETAARAKRRFRGIAACTGSFHNPRSFALADFLQKDGQIISGAATGRWFFATTDDGEFTITDDYSLLKGRAGVSAIALGQRLVPLRRDGFSRAFMNRVTDRMALGMSRDHLYIVEGKSDLWALASFLESKLACGIAINSDGGHVVRGRAPVHIVFRWRRPTYTPAVVNRASATPLPRKGNG